MKTLFLKYWIYLVVFVIAGFIGLLIGRSNTTESIKYVKGETVTDTIYKEKIILVKSEIPKIPILPTKTDTIFKDGKPVFTYLKVDTAQIIANYVIKHTYKTVAFDDNNGKLTLTPIVQYNELQSYGYEFTPITKVITKTRTLIPFINASYNTMGYFGAGGGLYYHNVGVGVSYLTNFSNKGLELGLHYKF